MTQEDKELLAKDLFSRALSGIKVNYRGNVYTLGYNMYLEGSDMAFESYPMKYFLDNVDEVKPYLRHMTSMTKEEQREFAHIIKKNYDDYTYRKCYYDVDGLHFGPDTTGFDMPDNVIDAIVTFYNKHHFDYRGLIEKGLAIEAPEGMYKTVFAK